VKETVRADEPGISEIPGIQIRLAFGPAWHSHTPVIWTSQQSWISLANRVRQAFWYLDEPEHPIDPNERTDRSFRLTPAMRRQPRADRKIDSLSRV